MKESEFYIGWQNELPVQSKKLIRKLLFAFSVLILLVVLLVVFFVKPFNNYIFEFSNVKKFTGTYYEHPVAILVLDEGQSPVSGQNHALLVGYGKNGASTFIDPVEKEKGDLNGRKLKISGTLIYGDGKVLIELTEKEKSIIEVGEFQADTKSQNNGVKTLSGEVLDPKCWFGVMKPGEGKVHKSCAIRCISGGIPPVLRVSNNGINEYYLLQGKHGEPLNQAILPYVGELIRATGLTEFVNGWNVLKIDVKAIKPN